MALDVRAECRPVKQGRIQFVNLQHHHQSKYTYQASINIPSSQSVQSIRTEKGKKKKEDQSEQGYIQANINGEEDKQGQCLRPDDTSGLLVEPVMLWQCSSRESSEPFDDDGMRNGIAERTGLLWIWD